MVSPVILGATGATQNNFLFLLVVSSVSAGRQVVLSPFSTGCNVVEFFFFYW